MFVILNVVKDLLIAGAQMNPRISTLSEKIQSLDPDQIAEVEDFAEFLRVRGQDRALKQYATALGAPAFEAIWDNPEDAVYDAL